MHSSLNSLKQRLRQRADSEHEQAVLRIVIVAIVLIYLAFTYTASAPNAADQYLILWVLSVDVAFSSALFIHILASPDVNRVRRAIGMVNDAAMATAVMFLTGEAGASMIGVYLFITFGNGFRYGRSYLFACQSLCLVGYLCVLLFDDHWQLHQTVGWSLMVALVVLPLYVSTLLERIEQARAKAEEANLAKSTFLANMSHEMRTPLNGIVGTIELFRTTTLDPRQAELMRLLRHSVGMLRVLVDDVLDISKIEAGRLTVEIADFDLHGVVNGLVGLLRPHAHNKGLTLSALVDPAIDYELQGDPHHLAQVLLNLISNAIKFTERGSVELRVTMKSESVNGVLLRFEVRDTGIGIAEAAQPRIFERFVQADESTTRKYGGSGLGTTIAKQLVELMGGTIGLTSVVGKGSSFWFEVPLLHGTKTADKGTTVGASALLIAAESERPLVSGMVAPAFQHVVAVGPDDDVAAALDAMRERKVEVSAVFYCGDLVDAQRTFINLALDPRNESTPMIYVASGATYAASDAAELLRIEGVSLIARNSSPRQLHNALHAATSKSAGLGQVIDLRSVLEESRQHLHILVAEDNLTNQQIIKQLLEKAGHQVLLASDGEEALDIYERERVDVAILDFNMPERNGIEVTKAIRVMEPSEAPLPIMILSASVTPDARESARRAGADEFVGKPYDASVLLQTIDRMARRARNATRTPATADGALADVQDLSTSAAPILDSDRIAEVQSIAGDAEFMTRLIDSFQRDLDRLMSPLDDALKSESLAAIEDIVHAVRGAALGIGAARLAAICADVEKHAASGRPDSARASMARLRRCYDETCVQLSRLSSEGPRAAMH